ncbi:MAG: hypothetical protein J5812_03835 [Candidatus Methanomethylophilaceae archaeon]|nr:hypothetical protein [Candidatus Methanomethylophilaceae archaeon]MBR4216778.1 hypothetical protein [Candidatus Methanomethylophilaceae archaeon]
MSGEKENKLMSFIMNGRKTTNTNTESSEELLTEPECDSCEQNIERIEEELSAIREQLGNRDEGSMPAILEKLNEMESSLEEIRQAIEEPEKDEDDDALQEVKAGIHELLGRKADPTTYMTSREQMKTIIAAVERRDAEVSNKAFLRSMEQIAVMREDFQKLSDGIREKLDVMSAEEVLSSFEAYRIDLENILFDGGVFIGPFPYDKLNTIHQRIIGVVPTGDEEKDGMIAERLSDGYKLGNRVLVKERVMIYKLSESMKNETPNETVYDETGKLEDEE